MVDDIRGLPPFKVTNRKCARCNNGAKFGSLLCTPCEHLEQAENERDAAIASAEAAINNVYDESVRDALSQLLALITKV
jgi:hypothetical protein